jgi:hypothetical protein
MGLPGGAFGDPGFEESDFAGFELSMGLGWRHDFFGVFVNEALIKGAFIGFAFDHGGAAGRVEEAGFRVESEAGFAGAGVGAVAVEAGVRQDGADVFVEGDSRFREGRQR